MTNQRAGVLGTGHSYPAGILTNEDLEKIVEIYFKKDDRQTTEKNRDMIVEFEK